MKRLKKNKGQVVVEYMLLIAVGVLGIVVATKLFNDKVLGAISETITH